MTAPVATKRSIPLLERLRRALARLRMLHAPVVLFVRATPADCLRTLVNAAKPSQHRLHLRELFTEGRRYYIDGTRDGFRMTSNARLLWGRSRERTRFAATLYGSVTMLAEDVTAVRLRVQTNWLYTLRGFVVPAGITAIVLSLPWSLGVQVGAGLLLFGLAWVASRLNAALQAVEMVFFVQKALADLPPVELPELADRQPDVVAHPTTRDFREQWTRFYEEHREEE